MVPDQHPVSTYSPEFLYQIKKKISCKELPFWRFNEQHHNHSQEMIMVMVLLKSSPISQAGWSDCIDLFVVWLTQLSGNIEQTLFFKRWKCHIEAYHWWVFMCFLSLLMTWPMTKRKHLICSGLNRAPCDKCTWKITNRKCPSSNVGNREVNK